jgi:hypothetical protein
VISGALVATYSRGASHLLLALRADEAGFATIANLAFSGACWRLGRRLAPQAREALNVARAAARA